MLSRRTLLIATAAAGATIGVGSRPASAALPTFRLPPQRLHALPVARNPYALRSPLSIGIKAPFDSAGVSMYLKDGRLVDHPVKQAAYVINAIESHRLNGDRAYVERAVANGQRLVDRSVRVGAARYFPYRFDFDLHGRRELRARAPHYSCMAQGQALSAFVRLYEATGERRWLGAARSAYASFLTIGRSARRPWTTFVDAQGYLWFEEWPGPNSAGRALNGHVFSLYGLVDYWSVTKDLTAERLALGGALSAKRYAAALRQPGWMSQYCLTHRVADAKYHGVHIRQLGNLYALTGDIGFARLADTFLDDFPGHLAKGSGRIAAGRYSTLRVDGQGRVTSATTRTVTRASPVRFADRRGIRGRRGAWLRVENGYLAGGWVPEGAAHLSAPVDIHEWFHPRRLTLAAGAHVGVERSLTGRRGRTRPVSLARPTAVTADARAVIDGRLRYRVASGTLDGLWVDGRRARVN